MLLLGALSKFKVCLLSSSPTNLGFPYLFKTNKQDHANNELTGGRLSLLYLCNLLLAAEDRRRNELCD